MNPMIKRLLLLVLGFISYFSVSAQDTLIIYRKANTPIGYPILSIDSMSIEKNAFSSGILSLHLGDSIMQISKNEIDSLNFHPFKITNKKGFVIFRVDDAQSFTDIAAMSKVFDKYGFKMVNNFNMNISFSENLWKSMMSFQSNGHEIGDHTPNHTTGYTDLATDRQVQQFVNKPGVEKIVGRRVFFKLTYPSLESTKVEGRYITMKAGSSTITGNLSNIKAPENIIYTSEYGWVHLINKTDSTATAINIRNYWVGEELKFKTSVTEPLYKGYIYDVYLDEDALCALLTSSRVLFDYYGFKRPTFWAMLGNYLPVVRAETMQKVGPLFGYVGSICTNQQHYTLPLNFNQTDSLSRWAINGTTFFVENNTALQSQRHIANMVAKHQIAIDDGHFWYKNPKICPQYHGTNAEKLTQYLATLDSVLLFCKQNGIAVLPYERAIPIVFDQRQDSTVNMLPPLYNDLTNQGFPDGYTLDPMTRWVNNDGMDSDKFHSLKHFSNGNVFVISPTGGLDLGPNKLVFYAKGSDGVTLTFTVKQYIRAGGFTDLKTAVFKLKGASDNYVRYEATLDIPNSYDHVAEIRMDASNNVGKEVSVSGMFLGK